MFFQLIIHAIVVSLGPILQHILLTHAIPMYNPRLFIGLSASCNVVLWAVNNYLLPAPSILVDYLILAELPLAAFLFAQKGNRIRSVFLMTIYVGLQMVAVYLLGLVAFPAAEKLGLSADALHEIPLSIFMGFLSFLVYCPIILPSHWLLQKLYKYSHFSLWPLLLLPLPLSQTWIMHKLIGAIPSARFASGLHPLFALGLFLSLITDAAFCIGLIKIRQTNRLKEQIRTAQEQLNIQTSYYDQLQENILTINQIRHDLSNQLQAAYHLLEQGEHTQARSQLDQLQSNIQKKVGPNYCANLVVDAVLSQKAALCREQGIRLDINANLPEELPIDSAHLCSAFSNLLDNSIQGVLSYKEDEKHIELRAALHSDCLVIRCRNPALPPVSTRHSRDILRPHGLGLDILRQIAAQYDGNFVTEYKNRCFEAVLILKYKIT